jgi:hypothetical protein
MTNFLQVNDFSMFLLDGPAVCDYCQKRGRAACVGGKGTTLCQPCLNLVFAPPAPPPPSRDPKTLVLLGLKHLEEDTWADDIARALADFVRSHDSWDEVALDQTQNTLANWGIELLQLQRAEEVDTLFAIHDAYVRFQEKQK